MNVFYVPNSVQDVVIQLDENESNHCVKVLRLRLNDEITLFDGNGGIHLAKIIDAHHKKCLVQTFQSSYTPKPEPHIHIAIAPTKNIDRFEWFIEKAIEIGVGEITPLLCEKSERKQINDERLEKVVVAAMKQSLNAYKTILHPLTPFSQFVKNVKTPQKYIAHCEETGKRNLKELCEKKIDSLVLIGPEGDFSKSEIELAIQNSFQAVTLGTTRLRTETAGIVACHSIRFINE